MSREARSLYNFPGCQTVVLDGIPEKNTHTESVKPNCHTVWLHGICVNTCVITTSKNKSSRDWDFVICTTISFSFLILVFQVQLLITHQLYHHNPTLSVYVVPRSREVDQVWVINDGVYPDNYRIRMICVYLLVFVCVLGAPKLPLTIVPPFKYMLIRHAENNGNSGFGGVLRETAPNPIFIRKALTSLRITSCSKSRKSL